MTEVDERFNDFIKILKECPIGTIMQYYYPKDDIYIAGDHYINTDKEPIKCVGGMVPKIVYPELYQLVGHKFGGSLGSDVFHIPDCRSQVLIGESRRVTSMLIFAMCEHCDKQIHWSDSMECWVHEEEVISCGLSAIPRKTISHQHQVMENRDYPISNATSKFITESQAWIERNK